MCYGLRLLAAAQTQWLCRCFIFQLVDLFLIQEWADAGRAFNSREVKVKATFASHLDEATTVYLPAVFLSLLPKWKLIRTNKTHRIQVGVLGVWCTWTSFILQMSKLTRRKAKQFVQDRTANKWQNWKLHPGSLALKPMLLILGLLFLPVWKRK